ncbi:MAG: hypothetical protein WCE79_23340 [Xanthobacteraceae bacterium]
MPDANTRDEERPTTEEIRAALDRIAVSEAFRACPQLVAFLRYVVEATLRGGQDRIKGYTIAVEALGRGDDFNPQDDPIVRVEAMRLRRALQRYYADGGLDDSVRIVLPLGSYVPEFSRSMTRAEGARTEETQTAWHAFLAFLTAYLDDDRAGAARNAALIPSDAYPLDLVAVALIAAHRGETDAARELLQRLDASLPELSRVPAEAVASRIVRDLGQIEGVAAKL